MIIDSHTHIFSPEVISHRARYAERDAFFGALYSGAVARMVSAEELIAAMDAAGIDKAVATGWCWQNHDVCVEQNSWTLDVIRKYPDRLLALAAIQPNAGADAICELELCVARGMIGLGELNADGQSFRLDDANFLALAHRAAELGVPMLLHTNEPVGHKYPGKGQLPLADIYDFIKAVPNLRLILAHWGGGFPFYELMREVRKAATNVFYDSAASPLLYSPQIFRAVIDIVGCDKVLFGSDFPLILYPKRQTAPDYAPFLAEIRALDFSAEEWEKMMGKNAARVFTKG
ncbi:2-keto-4-carboxy-3-hexenedioate hydratase [Anaerolineae bacterium]|nr:2-keto-4-carboxy-3-hexenedioate hydratase [Anaerolineae bacterium]